MASAQVQRTVFIGRELEVSRDDIPTAANSRGGGGTGAEELSLFFHLSDQEENAREPTPEYYRLDKPMFEPDASSDEAPADANAPQPSFEVDPVEGEVEQEPSARKSPKKPRQAEQRVTRNPEPAKRRHRRTLREVYGSSPKRKSTRLPAPTSDTPAALKRGSNAGARRGRGASRGAKAGTTRGAKTSTTRGAKTGAARGAKSGATRASTTGEKRGRKPRTNARSESSSQEEWEVEKIVDSQIDADSFEHFYKVKWKGFPASENTWEPKSNLIDCLDSVEEYERRKKSKA